MNKQNKIESHLVLTQSRIFLLSLVVIFLCPLCTMKYTECPICMYSSKTIKKGLQFNATTHKEQNPIKY